MIPRRRASLGQTLAEFALVFPVFVFLLFALFDIGRLVFAYTSLTNAAREGARLAAVNQSEPLIDERVRGQAFAATPADGNDVDVTFEDPPSTVGACPSVVSVGCIVNVEVTTRIGPLTPVLAQILGPVDLTARSQLAVEFVCPNLAIPAYADPASCPKQP